MVLCYILKCHFFFLCGTWRLESVVSCGPAPWSPECVCLRFPPYFDLSSKLPKVSLDFQVKYFELWELSSVAALCV